MPSLTFLLDEDSASGYLKCVLDKLGHKYLMVADVLGQGSDDRVVIKYAEHTGAIVVTRNMKHFRSAGRKNGRRPRGRGIVYLTCEVATANASRFELMHDLLLAEHAIVQTLSDPRLVAEVRRDKVIFYR